MSGGRIKWLGHATARIESQQGKVILIDPWIEGNGKCPIKLGEVGPVDLVLVSHDHFDHMGDAAAVTQATGATLIAQPETCGRLRGLGVPEERVIFGMGMNTGGSVEVQGITVTMTQAFHSSETGSPCGYMVRLEDGATIYHAGDTGLFSSLELFGQVYKPVVALLPIGGVFTMGPVEAAVAARLLGAGTVIPIHYATFPILEPNADRFIARCREEAPGIKVAALEPGQELAL